MGEVPPLSDLYTKYQPKGFEFFIVYVREAHPGESYPHHASPEQKLSHARKLRELENVKIPILVDDLKGATHGAYGLLPNMIYLVDREGTVVYKSDWSDNHELKGVMDDLLSLDAMRKEEIPIIRQGWSERLHWIPMDPTLRERVYRRSGEKAIRDYKNVMGYLPYATDAEKIKGVS